MSASVASPSVLLNRILSLRESCPFLLASDTFVQSATLLTNELVLKARTSNPDLKVVYLSFETAIVPDYIDETRGIFIDLLGKDYEKSLSVLDHDDSRRRLIVIDSFNYIAKEKVVSFLKLIMKPNTVVYGVYHQDIPSSELHSSSSKGPSAYSYLHFLSSCVFDIRPLKFDDPDCIYYKAINEGPSFPVGVKETQQPKFYIALTYRRKSGRSLEYQFIVNSALHEYEVVNVSVNTNTGEDESLLENLTTFNLGTTKKQKEQREKVDLPFLEAQKSLGSVGGSIVYEFEKDDDYDEEDAFEDPF
ncbi:unnamed protein product [Pichia kudriavzevii]